MKIALVADHLGAPSPDTYPAGECSRVLPLANALADRGQQVTVYARQGSAAPAGTSALCPGVTICRVPAGPPRRLSAPMLLPHIAAFAGELAACWSGEAAPDVIHADVWTSGLAALAGARNLGIPVVQTFASFDGGALADGALADSAPAAPGTAARVRLEAAIGRSARVVLVGGERQRAALGRLGVPQASIRVMPPGVDVTRFRTSGRAAERGRRARLLMVSPPGDRRGPATALHALADVPAAELVIAGKPGRQALGALARRLGVHDRLTCLGGVSEPDMPPLMRSADVLVHLATGQRFATVPVEAMACGIPVVAAEDAAPGDAVIDGNTGFLVPPGDPAGLARRLRQLLASPMLREGYGIAAANRVASRYSWERVAEQTLAVYQSLAAPPMEAAA